MSLGFNKHTGEYKMVRSLTAFARKEYRGNWGALIWELRSVNQRYLEVFIRLPEDLRILEIDVRERVGRFIKRGKVDCTLRFQADPSTMTSISVNQALSMQLTEAAQTISVLLKKPAKINPMDILSWPGVLETTEQDLDPVKHAALDTLVEALQELVQNREREGTRLQQIIQGRCDMLAAEVKKVQTRMPEVHEKLRAKLKIRLAELEVDLDEARLEQEMVILAQKLDVAEEMERLASHVAEVRHILDQDQPIGRRLDFLMQELNREANTLASKSADLETTRTATEMKVLIEQMREQIQNIE